MADISRKPKLTLDIAPLLEMQWTGIPVFTRRLAEALLRQGGLELDFASNLVRFPDRASDPDAETGHGRLSLR